MIPLQERKARQIDDRFLLSVVRGWPTSEARWQPKMFCSTIIESGKLWYAKRLSPEQGSVDQGRYSCIKGRDWLLHQRELHLYY